MNDWKESIFPRGPFSRQTFRHRLVLEREAHVLMRWKVSVYFSRALFCSSVSVSRGSATVSMNSTTTLKLTQLNWIQLLFYYFHLHVSYLKALSDHTEIHGRLCETLYSVFCNWRKWLMSSSTVSSSAYWHRCFLWLIKTSAQAEVGWNHVWNFIEVNNRCVQFKGRTYMGAEQVLTCYTDSVMVVCISSCFLSRILQKWQKHLKCSCPCVSPGLHIIAFWGPRTPEIIMFILNISNYDQIYFIFGKKIHHYLF